MKYPKLTSFFGIATLSFHSSMMGKNHVRLTEEQCQQLEDHFAEEKPAENPEELTQLQSKFDALQENYNALETSNKGLSTAIETALNLNGLKTELGETATSEEAIALLGEKCKEYGNSNNRHSLPPNNGITPPDNGLINGVVDMNDPHNQY